MREDFLETLTNTAMVLKNIDFITGGSVGSQIGILFSALGKI